MFDQPKPTPRFFKKIRSKVVNNLQIFINKIHIRFEDDQSNSRQPYAAGFTIEHFHAQSTDGDWRPTFLKLQEEISYKVCLSSRFLYARANISFLSRVAHRFEKSGSVLG